MLILAIPSLRLQPLFREHVPYPVFVRPCFPSPLWISSPAFHSPFHRPTADRFTLGGAIIRSLDLFPDLYATGHSMFFCQGTQPDGVFCCPVRFYVPTAFPREGESRSAGRPRRRCNHIKKGTSPTMVKLYKSFCASCTKRKSGDIWNAETVEK